MFIQNYGNYNQGGEPAVFHPSQISSAVGIWEADVDAQNSSFSTASNGDEVYRWLDQSPRAYQADRDASGPIYNATGINGGPSFTYDNGNTDVLVVTNSDVTPLLPETDDFHVFVVANFDTSNTNTRILFCQGDRLIANNGSIETFVLFNGSTLRVRVNMENDGINSDQIIQILAGGYAQEDFLYELKRENTTLTLNMLGLSDSTTISTTHAIQQDGFVLGGSGDPFGTTYFARYQGEIAAFYVFNDVVSGTDLTNFRAYILDKYNVT